MKNIENVSRSSWFRSVVERLIHRCVGEPLVQEVRKQSQSRLELDGQVLETLVEIEVSVNNIAAELYRQSGREKGDHTKIPKKSKA